MKKFLFLPMCLCVLLITGIAQAITLGEQDKAEEYADMAYDMIRQGDFDKGLKLYNLATKTDPYNVEWHIEYAKLLMKKGEAYIRAGHKQEAKRFFRAITKEYTMTSNILRHQGDNTGAANFLFQIAEINKNILGKRVQAAQYYAQTLQLNPNHAGAKSALGK